MRDSANLILLAPRNRGNAIHLEAQLRGEGVPVSICDTMSLYVQSLGH